MLLFGRQLAGWGTYKPHKQEVAAAYVGEHQEQIRALLNLGHTINHMIIIASMRTIILKYLYISICAQIRVTIHSMISCALCAAQSIGPACPASICKRCSISSWRPQLSLEGLDMAMAMAMLGYGWSVMACTRQKCFMSCLSFVMVHNPLSYSFIDQT